MAGERFFTPSEDISDKAGYNQAGEIARILSMLRLTFTSAMLEGQSDLTYALEACRAVLNIISGKVSAEKIEVVDEKVKKIEFWLPHADSTYLDALKKGKYYKNPGLRLKLKKEIESLWRELERIQDEYGYGMFSEDDSGL